MGIYDRDYTHAPRRTSFSERLSPQSITMWLIAINVGVFIINNIVVARTVVDGRPVGYHPIAEYGYFSVATAVLQGQVWRFLTFQFLHADLSHIVFNMLAMYFFGPLVETALGSKRFLPFYLLSGIGGAALYVILLALNFRIGNAAVPLVGASAGIFGVLIAAAMLAPNATVLFMMIFPMPLRTLVWLFIAFAAFQVLSTGANAGGEAAHLGGAGVGWLLMQRPRLLDYLTLPKRRRTGW